MALASAAPPNRAVESGALRRFHAGDPRASAPPAPDGVRPAAGAAAAAAGADPGGSIEGLAALLALATDAARRRLEAARAELEAETRELVALADRLLEADRERRADGAAARAGRLGPLGSRLFDAGRVAEVVVSRRAGEPLPAERRRELEAARGRLAGFGALESSPHWVVSASIPEAGLASLDAPLRTAADPAAIAVEEFDELAAAFVPVVAAARRIRLEAAGELDPERHPAALDRLDAWAFEPRELACVPPVIALLPFAELAGAGLAAASRLLRSGRPVQLVAFADERDDAEPGAALTRLEPALVGLAHREAFVAQGSAARPAALADGFERALASGRPGWHLVDLAGPGVAAARVAGRIAPLVRYEPAAGAGWSRRIELEGNPAPGDDWPVLDLDPRTVAAGAPVSAPFTAADAALLDPARRAHFALAGDDEADLVPIAAWLELSPEERLGRLPFVWALDGEAVPVRLVVSTAMARFALERRELWRSWSELAGVRGEPLEAAAALARRDAEERAAADLAALEAAHRAELERVRGEAAGALVERLVGGLLRAESSKPTGGGSR